MTTPSLDTGVHSRFDLEKVFECRTPADWQLNTHISLKNQYVFFQVCKAGGSTIVHHLQTIEFQGSHFTVQDPRNKYMSPHLSPYQLPASLVADVMRDPSWRKVAFVRNPYTRLLSCYLHRIVAVQDSPSARWFRRVSGETETPSFRRFVEVVSSQASIDMERHWRVQSDELMTDIVRLDFVGRFEQLQTDLHRLAQFLFGENAFDRPSLDGVNASPMQTNASDRVREFYTEDLRDLVANRYRSDFELFGYPFELPA